jgi:hypothetical protein
VRGIAKYPSSAAISHRVAESVWVCLGILVEDFAGRRFSHQSSPFLERSRAAPCGTDIVYIKLIVMGLCGLMRGSAVRCGGLKITFRVRCIQPGSATSPLCLHHFTRRSGRPSTAIGSFDGTCAPEMRSTAACLWFTLKCAYRLVICAVRCPRSSPTVCKSTPAMTSLLAKVWPLQCQV